MSKKDRTLALPAKLPAGQHHTPNGVLLHLYFDDRKRYVASFTPIEMQPGGGYSLLITDLMGPNRNLNLFSAPRFNAKTLDALWTSVTAAGPAVVAALEAGNASAALAAIQNAVDTGGLRPAVAS